MLRVRRQMGLSLQDYGLGSGLFFLGAWVRSNCVTPSDNACHLLAASKQGDAAGMSQACRFCNEHARIINVAFVARCRQWLGLQGVGQGTAERANGCLPACCCSCCKPEC
jgi:hypothetical protein